MFLEERRSFHIKSAAVGWENIKGETRAINILGNI
jgi:hypothetical protein